MPIEEHNSGIPLIEPPADSAYIAALWEHPNLCLAFFGVQFYTEAGQRLYEDSGIQEEMFPALETAKAEGLFLNRPMTTPEGRLLMQYWRSYNDLGLGTPATSLTLVELAGREHQQGSSFLPRDLSNQDRRSNL